MKNNRENEPKPKKNSKNQYKEQKTVKIKKKLSDSSEEKEPNISILQFQDENDRFRTLSRTKTPFFLMSDRPEQPPKEGLDLIKQISQELDSILMPPESPSFPSDQKKPAFFFENQVNSKPVSLSKPTNLPKPTRRDLDQYAEKSAQYKTSIPNDFSCNKTFSFS